jgi:hypothetical protein
MRLRGGPDTDFFAQTRLKVRRGTYTARRLVFRTEASRFELAGRWLKSVLCAATAAIESAGSHRSPLTHKLRDCRKEYVKSDLRIAQILNLVVNLMLNNNIGCL